MTSTDTELFRVVIGLLLAVLGVMLARIWINIDRLSAKMDKFMEAHYECQKNLPEIYLSKNEFAEWRLEWRNFLATRSKDWDELWRSFNSHQHNGGGKVIR